jgi:hypothetical protein
MDFSSFMARAWADHAADAQAVARRLPDAVALVGDEAQLGQLVNLAQHVHGEHLGEWQAGIAFIERLAGLPVCVPGGAGGQACARGVASLRLAQGAGADLDALSVSDRVRVVAMAASSLAERDTARAQRLLQDALELAQRSGLPASDPMNRALAVTGNNLACALEEKAERSAGERALMVLAAQTARRHWALAGGWLEIERAEYRLATTWRHAGEPARAREHAQACLAIVAANDGPALERLFGCEALGLAERAAGNAAGHAQALAQARAAFAELEPADQAWCAASLDKLAG